MHGTAAGCTPTQRCMRDFHPACLLFANETPHFADHVTVSCRCEPCISPYYQGILTDYLQPITGATKANPYPACIYCTVSEVQCQILLQWYIAFLSLLTTTGTGQLLHTVCQLCTTEGLDTSGGRRRQQEPVGR
jgi:hypothetical protein